MEIALKAQIVLLINIAIWVNAQTSRKSESPVSIEMSVEGKLPVSLIMPAQFQECAQNT